MKLTTDMTERIINIISPDDFTRCPDCGSRVESDDTEVDRDEDGPIYEAFCPDHGWFLWQVIEDDNDMSED